MVVMLNSCNHSTITQEEIAKRKEEKKSSKEITYFFKENLAPYTSMRVEGGQLL